MRAWSSGGSEVMCRPVGGFRACGGAPRRRAGSLMRDRVVGLKVGGGGAGAVTSNDVLVVDEDTEVCDEESASESEAESAPAGLSSRSGSSASSAWRWWRWRRPTRKFARAANSSPTRSMAGSSISASLRKLPGGG